MAYPVPEVFWLYADDAPVETSYRISYTSLNNIQNSIIMIKETNAGDVGVYVCVAENALGKFVHKFSLIVLSSVGVVRIYHSLIYLFILPLFSQL